MFYAILGLFVCLSMIVDNQTLSATTLFSGVICYIVLPIYGIVGVKKKDLTALLVMALLFLFISVRFTGEAAWLPVISPIAISFPITDFPEGEGYLLDVFALLMTGWFCWLLIDVLKHRNRQL